MNNKDHQVGQLTSKVPEAILYFEFHHVLFYPVDGWHSASCVAKCRVSNVGFDKMCSECLLELLHQLRRMQCQGNVTSEHLRSALHLPAYIRGLSHAGSIMG